jgi:hypothetical protein
MAQGEEVRNEVLDYLALEYVNPKHGKRIKDVLVFLTFRVATEGALAMSKEQTTEIHEALERRGEEVQERMGERIRESLERGR